MKLISILGVSLVLAGTTAAQRPVRFTHEVSVLDLTQCLAQPGAVPVPIKPQDVNLEIVDWATISKPEPFVGEFTLSLTEARLVGSVFVYGAEAVRYQAAGRWKQIEPGPEKGRLLQMLPLPPGDLVEKVLVQVRAHPHLEGEKTVYRATLPFLTIIPLRTLNVAGQATVTASSLAPGGAPAKVLVDGVVSEARNFSTAPREAETSEASPEWVVLSWKEPQSIRGVGLLRGSHEAGFGRSVTEFYKGAGDPIAAAAQTEGWEQVQGRATLPGAFRSHQLLVSPSSLDTRAVRIRSVGAIRQLSLGELIILNDLGYAPGPVSARALDEPAARQP
jgi:hypothetical protein